MAMAETAGADGKYDGECGGKRDCGAAWLYQARIAMGQHLTEFLTSAECCLRLHMECSSLSLSVSDVVEMRSKSESLRHADSHSVSRVST
jgi:hypothetical protein